MKKGYNIGLPMTRTQAVLGWLYLPVYFVLLGIALDFLPGLLHTDFTPLTKNILYFSVNFLMVLLIFHKFLSKSFRGFTEHFWPFVQVAILSAVMYYFLLFLLSFLLEHAGVSVENPNDTAVTALVRQSKGLMVIFTVAVTPIVEETLIRGVVFGTIHRKSRIAAYIVSILLFSAMHVWQHYSAVGLVPVLISALKYIPASIALGWSYEKAGTIWTPIVVHGFINAVTCGITIF